MKSIFLISFLSLLRGGASYLLPAKFGVHHLPSLGTTASTQTRLFGKRGNGKVKKERISKQDLPEKVCVVCNRPFTWRKKWERCWDEVTTCSKKCNSMRRGAAREDGFVDYGN